MKRIFLVLFLFVGILFLGSFMFNTSFAYSYSVDNSVLFYKDDYDELENDIDIYISNIDDFIISNSSFLYSDELVNNYDFLVRFAIDYILGNSEYYDNEIKRMDSCKYVNSEGIEREVFDYVSLNAIYDIIDFYFGVRDFVVINDDVCVVDDYVSLSNYSEYNFNYEIRNVSVSVLGLDVLAVVSYEDGRKYLFTFYNDNNVLKIRNVEAD